MTEMLPIIALMAVAVIVIVGMEIQIAIDNYRARRQMERYEQRVNGSVKWGD